jgi:hypothetical protein
LPRIIVDRGHDMLIVQVLQQLLDGAAENRVAPIRIKVSQRLQDEAALVQAGVGDDQSGAEAGDSPAVQQQIQVEHPCGIAHGPNAPESRFHG